MPLTWTNLTQSPSGKANACSALTTDGRFIEVGGTTTASPTAATAHTGTKYVYDPSDGTWTTLSALAGGFTTAFMGPQGLPRPAWTSGNPLVHLVYYGDNLGTWDGGRLGYNLLTNSSPFSHSNTKDHNNGWIAEVWDSASSTWFKYFGGGNAIGVMRFRMSTDGFSGADFDLPNVVHYSAATNRGNQNGLIYVAGGRESTTTVAKFYSIGTGLQGTTAGAVTNLASLPEPLERGQLHYVPDTDKFIYVGGVKSNQTTPSTAVYQYDPASNGWSLLGSLPTSTIGQISALVGNDLYVWGGYQNNNPMYKASLTGAVGSPILTNAVWGNTLVGHRGPYKSTDGSVYVFSFKTHTAGTGLPVSAWKSTNGGASFSEVATWTLPTDVKPEGIDVKRGVVDANVLHVLATYRPTSASTQANFRVRPFNMSTDAWGTATTEATGAVAATLGSTTAPCHAFLAIPRAESTLTYLVAHHRNNSTVVGLDMSRWNGSTWAVATMGAATNRSWFLQGFARHTFLTDRDRTHVYAMSDLASDNLRGTYIDSEATVFSTGAIGFGNAVVNTEFYAVSQLGRRANQAGMAYGKVATGGVIFGQASQHGTNLNDPISGIKTTTVPEATTANMPAPVIDHDGYAHIFYVSAATKNLLHMAESSWGQEDVAVAGTIGGVSAEFIDNQGIGIVHQTGSMVAYTLYPLQFYEGPWQYLRPMSDISAVRWTDASGGTTNLWASIDEDVPNDSDYIRVSP